jgi:hypothetical protein
MQQGEQKLGDTNYHYVKCNVLNSLQHKEIGDLKERIKRLEAAGDAMERLLPDGTICDKVANLWLKAKESQ